MFENVAQPENIFDDMEDWIEEKGNNPVESFGIVGRTKELIECGSLLGLSVT